ncbi:tetratricopeptide repeat protein [Vibrio alfacsensis]|uniref:tetratricopeptide repeat protein n=1 Tax=Vibrio alfacsensis TaxID=1074311 RepID=UPI001BF0EBBC|nr:tetratricopeptide repeat protein [Vibrio alfacsensis]BCN24099.1 hypothetical protein VYA_12910 [Vibrio alfacsensis]
MKKFMLLVNLIIFFLMLSLNQAFANCSTFDVESQISNLERSLPPRFSAFIDKAKSLKPESLLALAIQMDIYTPSQFESSKFVLFCYAANQGSDKAALRYALAYESGSGVEKNESKAFNIINTLVKNGDSHILYTLARYHQVGVGTVPDPELAMNYYQAAAWKGSTLAKLEVADSYLLQLNTEYNFDKALALYQAVLMFSDPRDLNYLHALAATGYMHFFGLGIEKDKNKGLEIMLSAQSQHNGFGSFALARAYYCGCSRLEKNIVKSIYYFNEAIKNGYSPAHIELARVYVSMGKLTEAQQHFMLAKKHGYPIGSFGLAYIYRLQKDNKSKYNPLFEESIEKGNALALRVLGIELLKRVRNEGDIHKGLVYIWTAASKGDVDALVFLSNIYLSGEYVNKDENKAYFLAQLSFRIKPSYNVSSSNKFFDINGEFPPALIADFKVCDSLTTAECLNVLVPIEELSL